MDNADNLTALIALARREMPEVPSEVWERFAVLAGLACGGRKIYVGTQKKRRHLEALAAADETQDAEKLAALLGVSVRRIQQLKRLG